MRWGLLAHNRVIATAEDTKLGRDLMLMCLQKLRRSKIYSDSFKAGLRVAREESPGVYPRWTAEAAS